MEDQPIDSRASSFAPCVLHVFTEARLQFNPDIIIIWLLIDETRNEGNPNIILLIDKTENEDSFTIPDIYSLLLTYLIITHHTGVGRGFRRNWLTLLAAWLYTVIDLVKSVLWGETDNPQCTE